MKTYAQMTKAELIQRIANLEKRQSAGGVAFAHERIAHELEVHQVELETQNQELQQSRQLLEDSRDRYADLYDFAPVGLLTLDSRGTIRELNLTACAMLGAERTRLLHQPFHTHVAEADRAQLRPHLQPREPPGARLETELQLVWKGRPTIVVNVQSVLVGDDETGDLRCRAALTDVTAHRRAEAALRQATERFEVAVAGSAEGLWDRNLITDVSFYSPRFKELLGFSPTDRRFPDLFASFKARLHPDDLAATEDAIARAVRDGVPYRATYRLKTASGDWRWFEARGATLRDARGAATRMAGSITDITERRQTEESLRASEQRFRHLVESTRMIGWERPVKGTSFTYVSPWAREALGYPLADWMKPGFFHKQMVHPDDRKALAQRSKEELAREDDYELEYRLVTADGRTLWFRDIVHVVRGLKGPEVLKGFLSDITERKHAEAALRESELQQRLALEGGDIGLWDYDVPTGHLAMNERWCAMIGHTVADLAPHLESWRERVHPDDWRTAQAAWEAHRDGQTASYETEYRLRHKNGGWVWILDKGRIIERAAGGQPIRVCGTHLDITQRKMAEAALRLSEERFRQMSGAINQVFWMTSVDKSEMLYVSPAYERIWGRTCASLYAAPRTWLDAVHPEDRAELMADVTAQQTAGTYDVEYRILRPDGAERWIRDRAFPIGDGAGTLQGIAGIAEDITERRWLRAELTRISDDVQQRIGQDLHDDICQQLAGITFRLECLLGDLQESSAAHRGLAEISGLLRSTTVAARTMAHTLSPVSVEPHGLSDALEGLATRSATLLGIPVDFLCTQPVTVADAVAAGHLYRIAQEAITNAWKHGQARRIRVTLAATPDGGSLTIADNGRGCALPIPGHGGMGLRIMRYRAGQLRAALHFQRTKGGGLTIRCAFRPPNPTP